MRNSSFHLERGQATLPDLFFFMALGKNKSGRVACPR